MPVETGFTISQLDKSWPLGTDPVLDGDDHLRLIKSVLKTQFPGSSGKGFGIPITTSEIELNYSSGLVSNIQDQIDGIANNQNLIAPTGTVLVFYQSAPPLGWAKSPGIDDSMLRVVSSNGGVSGGSDSPISFDISHNHATASVALSIAQMPNHGHGIANSSSVVAADGPYTSPIDPQSGSSPSGHIETHLNEGDGEAHGHGDTSTFSKTFSPKYSNMIMAVKA